MNKCICHICGTENEIHYEYCKNCGVKLEKIVNNEAPVQPASQQSDSAYTPVSPYTSQYKNNTYTAPQNSQYYRHTEPLFNETYGITEIDGVKTEDLAAYIGPNNKKIINKFTKMELSSSKVNWCWPAAVWGLLGPCGVALWFIYRKMYKLGIIILAIGVLLDCAVATIGNNGTSSFDNFANDFFGESIVESEYGELEEIPEIEEGNKNNKQSTMLNNISLLFGDIVWLSSVAFGGLFSMYFYKKHTINKIKHYNLANASERYRQIGLMAVGGTSAGMAVLAFFLSIVFTEIIERIIFIFI